MTINNIRKTALTLAVLEMLSLSACTIRKNTSDSITSDKGISSISIPGIDINSFFDITPTPVMTRFEAEIYSIDGKLLGTIPEFTKCIVIKENNTLNYSLIRLENGTEVIIHSSLIYEIPNLVGTDFTVITENKDKVITGYTEFYNTDGTIISGLWEGFTCRAVATNGEYTLVTMDNNGSEYTDGVSGVVKNEFLADRYLESDIYAYAKCDAKIYCEKELISEAMSVCGGKLLKVLYITEGYAAISLNMLHYLLMQMI